MDSWVNSKEFWEKVEEELHENVPSYVKFALQLQSLDDPQRLKHVSSEELLDLQLFIHSDLFQKRVQMQNDPSLQLCNGQSQSQGEFCFSQKEVDMLKRILQLSKNKPDDFWRKIPMFVESVAFKELREKSRSSLLPLFYLNFMRNCDKKPQGFRYDDITKLICAYFYLVGGP